MGNRQIGKLKAVKKEELIERGKKEFFARNYRDAVKLWQQLAETDLTPEIRSYLAEAHFLLALEAYRGSLPLNSAISELNLAIKYVSDNPTYWYHLGLAYFKAGIMAKALSSFKKASALDPSCDQYKYHQALAALELNLDEATTIIIENLNGKPCWRYLEALVYLKENKPEHALKVLEQIADQRGEVLFLQAIALLARGNTVEAQRLLQRSIDKSPDNPATGYYLGLCHAMQGGLDLALECWERAYAKGLNSERVKRNLSSACFNRALDHLTSGHSIDEAIRLLRRAAEICPQNVPEARRLLAEACFVKGNRAAESHDLAEAVKSWLEANAHLESLIKEAVESEERKRYENKLQALYHNLAIAYDQLSQPERAIPYWEKVIRRWKKGYNDDLVVATYRHLAEDYEKVGRLTDAISAYEQVQRRCPDLIEIHEQIAELALAEDICYKAAQHFERLLELRGEDSLTHTKLGVALMSLGRRKEALAHWRRAVELDPRNRIAKLEIFHAHEPEAFRHFKEGRYEQALRMLQELLEFIPDLATIRFKMSIICWAMGDKRGALDQIELAVKSEPKNVATWAEAVGILLAKRQQKLAEEYIARAEAEVQRKPHLYAEIGRVYLRMDDLTGAMECYEKAIRLARAAGEDYSALAENIASDLAEAGEFKHARKYYQIALEVRPDDAELLYELGCALAEDGIMEEAQAMWQKAERIARAANDQDLLDDIRWARKFFTSPEAINILDVLDKLGFFK